MQKKDRKVNRYSFFFFGQAHSMQKFLGQGSKASHSSDNGDTLTAKPLEKSNMIHLGVFVCFLFFSFEGCTCGTWKFPGQGLNWSCSYRPTPQLQQGLILNPLSKDREQILMDTMSSS